MRMTMPWESSWHVRTATPMRPRSLPTSSGSRSRRTRARPWLTCKMLSPRCCAPNTPTSPCFGRTRRRSSDSSSRPWHANRVGRSRPPTGHATTCPRRPTFKRRCALSKNGRWLPARQASIESSSPSLPSGYGRALEGSARADPSARLPEFRGSLLQQLSRHDQQLELLGALEDVEDLRVPRPLLEQLVLAVPDAAAQLHAAERDVDAGAARLRLGHRGLQRVGLAVVGHPGRLQGEQQGGLVV